MKEEILFFFEKRPSALPLYEALEERILTEIGGVLVKVQKTQITFYKKHVFACVSFAPVKKEGERPACFITVTFGLPYQLQAPRIAVATEPYPNRWSHHVLVTRLTEIDQELLSWLKEAAVFSAGKGRKKEDVL